MISTRKSPENPRPICLPRVITSKQGHPEGRKAWNPWWCGVEGTCLVYFLFLGPHRSVGLATKGKVLREILREGRLSLPGLGSKGGPCFLLRLKKAREVVGSPSHPLSCVQTWVVLPLTPGERSMEDGWLRGISPYVSVFWNLPTLYSSDGPEVLCVRTGHGLLPQSMYLVSFKDFLLTVQDTIKVFYACLHFSWN